MTERNKRDPAFDLDRALADWSRGLKRTGGLEDGMIAELEGHVKDEVDDLVRQGLEPEAAFRRVTGALEDADLVGREYFKTRARGLIAVPPRPAGGFSPALLLNTVKVSFRKMRRQKWYSLISVTGLAAGIACAVLILLWVRHELSCDQFHKSAENIYRVTMEDRLNDGLSIHPWLPFPLGPALKDAFPEIAAVSRWRPDDMVVRFKDKAFTEPRFLTVDPDFFTMFSFPFVRGNPAEALADPHSIVIRDTMAAKYFGDEDPIGKALNLGARADLAVSGVVHIPEVSDFQFDFFFSFQSYPLFKVDLAPLEANWSGKNYHVYLLLREGASAAQLQEKISGFLKPRTPGRTEVLRLQKLSRIHLYHPDGSDAGMRYVRIFSLTAFFVLFIACVNFMNLATARFEGRAKEVALRKTLGGTRGQLVRQFFGESFLHSGLAMAAALLVVELALPAFRQLTGRRIGFDLAHPGLVLGLLAIVLVAGFVSGLYPALFLSSFAPARARGAHSHPKGHGSLLRKCLVVLQFTLSTMLIIGTLVVMSQVSFMRSRDPGMTRDDIVTHLMQSKTRDSVEVVREELLRHPDILSVTSCSHLPINIQSWIGYLDWEGRDAEKEVHPAFLSVDPDFVKTLGLAILEGRDFSRERPADAENFIINETARRQMELEHPIGAELRFWGRRGQIIGVVGDFSNQHMSSATAPVILTTGWGGQNRNHLLLKLRPGNPAGAIEHFRKVWAGANPGFPSEVGFLDEAFDRMYTNERKFARILFAFAVLAVMISCLGLVGLASFTAEEKTKEIGVRRVLGASSREVVFLFSMKFTKLVLVANAIAWPAAYVLMKRWLEGYAFRTTIGVGLFALAGALSLACAVLSVGYQTFRAATADPVRSLRYE
jgi:putative ABC transport system permease protein